MVVMFAMMRITRKLSAVDILIGLLMILSCTFSSTATDTITLNSSLNEIDEETLVSATGRFELGFFNLNRRKYVGIWYKSNPEIIVWVANRDRPLSGNSRGVFTIAENGELQVLDGITIHWSNKISMPSKSARARLLDNGNLVLENEDATLLMWQSFDHPTDTFLPGMKMRNGVVLSCWKSQVDPAVGNFTFQLRQGDENQFIIMKESSTYWNSGVSGKFIESDENIQLNSYLTMNLSTRSLENSHVKSKSKTINYDDIILPASVDYNNTRLVLNYTGLVHLLVQNKTTHEWTPKWQEPRDICSVFDFCGSFSSCNSENRLHCKCLPGFEPQSPENWTSGVFSEGCKRISSMCDGNVSVTTSFLELKKVRAGKPDNVSYELNQTLCKNACLGDCQCQAYSYSPEKVDGGTCWSWRGDSLKNIQELYINNGRDLNIHVKHSDIEPSSRSCETCGSIKLPYPLSTGPHCGDQNYNSFKCENTTGQLYFKAANESYRVSNIDAESLKFSIQVLEDCTATASDPLANSLPLDSSSPFRLIHDCNLYPSKFSEDLSMQGNILNELQIQWDHPPQPLCLSTRDCSDLLQATCNTTLDGMQRCVCNKDFLWDFKTVTCIPAETSSRVYSSRKRIPPFISIFLGAIAAILLISCAIIYLFYLKKHRLVIGREKNRESIQSNITSSSFYESEKRVKEFIDSGQFKEEDKKGINVPFIDLESILTATDDFSSANKLGQGGFGPVYKGKFPGGKEIAIKRLSSGSGQGLEEFKNEVILIAKLQHRNLVRLLGYYVDRHEKMLLYEYMPNRSLDAFIFDRTLRVHLNWELRFNIIMGIARGLLYLHHDSRLRIIHRDLKTSNVLLDEEMTPKISDFGLARIFDGKQTEASTQRVVGTYGYMSPEYALDGFFSIKSDVFSFGVVLLEILSGKRNTAFYKSDQAMNLLGYAWRLWKEQKAVDLTDHAIRETCNASEFVRCLNIGLLCVQEEPNDRPTMSSVIFMLGSETTTLPIPKEPVFIVKRSSLSGTTSSSRGDGVLELTASLEQGR